MSEFGAESSGKVAENYILGEEVQFLGVGYGLLFYYRWTLFLSLEPLERGGFLMLCGVEGISGAQSFAALFERHILIN